MARKPIFPTPPPLLGRRAGTISRLTTGDSGGSLYFLILLGGVSMPQKHVFWGLCQWGWYFCLRVQ